MPRYDYHCPFHGRQEILKPMAQATDPEQCPRCVADPPPWQVAPMQRVFTPPVVQNLTATAGSLRSWGRNLRLEGTKTMEQKIAECEAARGESQAATMGGD